MHKNINIKSENYGGAKGIREVKFVGYKGVGQIEVVNGTAYVGHTVDLEATSIIDV